MFLIAALDMLYILALEKHVGFTDGVGGGIELLTEKIHRCILVEIVLNIILANGKHTAGTARGIVKGFDNSGLSKFFFFAGKDESGHKSYDIARGIVFSG